MSLRDKKHVTIKCTRTYDVPMALILGCMSNTEIEQDDSELLGRAKLIAADWFADEMEEFSENVTDFVSFTHVTD
jgi:hypothetical protein